MKLSEIIDGTISRGMAKYKANEGKSGNSPEQIMKMWDAETKFVLGYVDLSGKRRGESLDFPIMLIKISAEAGFMLAQFVIGNCYEEGYGVSRDISKAMYWWRKAAIQGLDDAKDKVKRAEAEEIERERRAAKERKDKYNGLVEAKNKATTEIEYQKLTQQFREMNGYADTAELTIECENKYRVIKKRREAKERKAYAVGLILQISVLASFVYIFFGTEIVRGSVQDIISIALAKNIPDPVYLIPLIWPLFFYALTIGFIGSIFIIKKKRINYLFYITAILIQTILFAMWTKEYLGEALNYQRILPTIIVLSTIVLPLIIIPGAIVGIMKKKTATFTLLIFLIISLMAGYSYHSGWFDDYSEKKNYADGMAAVKYGNYLSRKWGFMNENGEEVIPCIYSNVLNFSEGLAAVRIDNKVNGKWGFIDKDGTEITSFKYDAVESFSEGLAKVRIGNTEDGKWGFIDKDGTEIVPCKYYSAESFSEGLALVKNDSKWGFIDKSGRIVISLKFDAARSFSDGYAQVGEAADTGVRGWNFKWGLIDRRGNLIVPYKYGYIGAFNGDLAVVRISRNESSVAENNRTYTRVVDLWGVINKSGKEIISLDTYYNISIREGLIEVKTDRNANIQHFDKSGNKVTR